MERVKLTKSKSIHSQTYKIIYCIMIQVYEMILCSSKQIKTHFITYFKRNCQFYQNELTRLIQLSNFTNALQLNVYCRKVGSSLFKNKTKQNKTKQNKTKQNKTKQNKTKQNKTKQKQTNKQTNKTKNKEKTNKPTNKQNHTHNSYPDFIQSIITLCAESFNVLLLS